MHAAHMAFIAARKLFGFVIARKIGLHSAIYVIATSELLQADAGPIPCPSAILFRVSLLRDFTRVNPVANVGLAPSDSTLAKFYWTRKIAQANQVVNVPRLVTDDAGKFIHADQSVHNTHDITCDHTDARRFGSG